MIDYCSAIKRRERLVHTIPQISLKNTVLIRGSQTKKGHKETFRVMEVPTAFFFFLMGGLIYSLNTSFMAEIHTQQTSIYPHLAQSLLRINQRVGAYELFSQNLYLKAYSQLTLYPLRNLDTPSISQLVNKTVFGMEMKPKGFRLHGRH